MYAIKIKKENKNSCCYGSLERDKRRKKKKREGVHTQIKRSKYIRNAEGAKKNLKI